MYVLKLAVILTDKLRKCRSGFVAPSAAEMTVLKKFELNLLGS